MFGNNFGLFGGRERARWMLRRLKRMTSAHARIVAHSLNPYNTELPEHLSYHRFNRRRGRMAGQLRIRVRYVKLATPWFDYLLASPEEMREIANGTGWHLAKTIAASQPPTFHVGVIEKD
jgi:hypothetical protein